MPVSRTAHPTQTSVGFVRETGTQPWHMVGFVRETGTQHCHLAHNPDMAFLTTPCAGPALLPLDRPCLPLRSSPLTDRASAVSVLLNFCTVDPPTKDWFPQATAEDRMELHEAGKNEDVNLVEFRRNRWRLAVLKASVLFRTDGGGEKCADFLLNMMKPDGGAERPSEGAPNLFLETDVKWAAAHALVSCLPSDEGDSSEGGMTTAPQESSRRAIELLLPIDSTKKLAKALRWGWSSAEAEQYFAQSDPGDQAPKWRRKVHAFHSALAKFFFAARDNDNKEKVLPLLLELAMFTDEFFDLRAFLAQFSFLEYLELLLDFFPKNPQNLAEEAAVASHAMSEAAVASHIAKFGGDVADLQRRLFLNLVRVLGCLPGTSDGSCANEGGLSTISPSLEFAIKAAIVSQPRDRLSDGLLFAYTALKANQLFREMDHDHITVVDSNQSTTASNQATAADPAADLVALAQFAEKEQSKDESDVIRRTKSLLLLVYAKLGHTTQIVKLLDELEVKNLLLSVSRSIGIALEALFETGDVAAASKLQHKILSFHAKLSDSMQDAILNHLFNCSNISRIGEALAHQRVRLRSLTLVSAQLAQGWLLLHDDLLGVSAVPSVEDFVGMGCFVLFLKLSIFLILVPYFRKFIGVARAWTHEYVGCQRYVVWRDDPRRAGRKAPPMEPRESHACRKKTALQQPTTSCWPPYSESCTPRVSASRAPS